MDSLRLLTCTRGRAPKVHSVDNKDIAQAVEPLETTTSRSEPSTMPLHQGANLGYLVDADYANGRLNHQHDDMT